MPVPQKVTLTIKEAAECSNIGINKLENLLRAPRCPFVLYATMYKFSLKLKPLCSIILTAILGLLFGNEPKMGKDLKGKELGVGIVQQANGLYVAHFTNKHGRRQSKRFKKLQECRQWIADATYIDEHTDIENATDMLVDAWFEYWISVKKKTVKPIHCQKIFSDMADDGYRTTTIYQTRIALYNMLEFAKENDVIINNPCKKSVKSDMGKPSDKKEALTIETQKKFLEGATGQSYENQYRFILQTGLRTGELVGLKWEDIDFENNSVN